MKTIADGAVWATAGYMASYLLALMLGVRVTAEWPAWLGVMVVVTAVLQVCVRITR